MFKRLAIAAVVAACLPSAVPAAPATTLAKEVRAALDDFCKPFASGQTTGVKAGAEAAGWKAYGISGFYRDGAWGRVNVGFYVGDRCTVTVPVGSAKGKELPILDVAVAWGKANGFTSVEARATTTRPLYDSVDERWTRDGKSLTANAVVNRRKDDMLVPDVSISVE